MSKNNNLKKGIITTIIAAVIATGAAGLAHQLDINQGMNDNAINLTTITPNNVHVVATGAFDNFFDEINEGNQSEDSSEQEVNVDETTGSATEEAEQSTNKTEESYNNDGMNANNAESKDDSLVQPDPEETISPAENPSANQTKSGVANKNWTFLAIGSLAAIAAAVASAIGLKKLSDKIKEKAEENGVTPASKQSHRETKLNSQSSNYSANKDLYHAQYKFMNATDATITTALDNANIEEIKSAKQKIQDNKLNIPETINLTKAYASGGKHENPLQKETDAKLLAKGVKTEAKIAQEVLKNNSKKVNKNIQERDAIKNQLQYNDSIVYASETPNMYESTSEKAEINTLNLNRAISNVGKLDNVLKQTHAELPWAESEIRTCKITITTKTGEVKYLECAFNNEIGYNVLKSALILEANKNKSKLDKIEISEQINKTAKQQPIVYKDLNTNNDFQTLIKKSEQYLDRFKTMCKAEIKTEQPQNSINQAPFNF